MSLEGTWKFTHSYKGIPSYHFFANLGANGSMSVPDFPQFFGIWTQLGPSNQVALAIADSTKPSITSYVGNVGSGNMGGLMTGGSGCPVSKTISGSWFATKHELIDVPQGAPGLPD